MIIVRFPDSASERKALGILAERFGFAQVKAAGDGREAKIPEEALAALASEGVRFQVEGVAGNGTTTTNGATKRPFGLCAGKFVVPTDFDAPLPEDVVRGFEG
jgi:hypothetical protein